MKGVDYSWARPGGAEIKAAGFDFAIRYVDYPGASGKGLRAPELEDLHANGVSVALVYESTAGRPLEGLAAGRADAHQSLAQLRALGFPEDRPVYFAVDFDAQPAQFSAILDYFAGAVSVLTVDRVGVYGGIRSLQRVAAAGLAKWYWQALAWSGGQTFPGRHIYQYLNGQTINGGAVDYNEAFAADFGQWPVQEEEDVELKERVERLEAIVAANGIAKDTTKPDELTFGEEAMAYAAERGWSAFLGIGQAKQSIADHAVSPHGGASGGGNVPAHTHVPGEVSTT